MAVLLFAAVFASSTGHAEGVQTLQGSTASGLTFSRPSSDCTASGQTSRFSAQKLVLGQAATCNIYSAQSYNGTIHLYGPSFSSSSPLSGCIAGNDDGDLGGGTSTLRNLALPAGTYTLVNSGYGSNDSGSFTNTVHCGSPLGTQPFVHNAQPRHGRCGSLDQTFTGIPKEQQLCLLDRFPVAVTGISKSPTGIGTPVRSGTRDTGLFWFYADTRWEVMVKVLDGCTYNAHWWVLIGASTDAGYTISVGDPASPANPVRTYTNTLGTLAEPVLDTTAFPCLPTD